jgi:hypothetical protein
LNKKVSVSSEKRASLKKIVDAIGRTKVSQYVGMPYAVLSQRLNGQQALDEEIYKELSMACDALKSK